MKTKNFVSEIKNLVKGNEVNNEMIWRSLEGGENRDNVYYFCIQLYEMLIHSEKKDFVI